MEGAIVKGHSRIQQLIPICHSAESSLAHAFFYGRHVFSRNRSAFDAIHENQTFIFVRLDLQIHMTILPAPAGLTDVFPFSFCRTGNRFSIRHLWRSSADCDFKFTYETVNDDFEMEFAHAGDKGLPSFRIGIDHERRVF